MNDPNAAAAGARPVRIAFLEFAAGVSRKNAWSFLYASWVSIALLGYLNFCQPLLLTEIAHVPAGEQGVITGWITGVGQVIEVLLVAFVGVFSDRLGRRPLFALGMLFTGLGYAAHAWADSVPKLFAARVLFGIGVTTVNVIISVVGADYPAESSRGKLAGAGGILNGIGFVMFVAVFSQLPQSFTARGATSLAASQYMVWSIAAVAIVSAVILQLGLKGGAPSSRGGGHGSVLSAIRVGMRAAQDNRRLMLGYVGTFMSRTNLTILATLISLWLQQVARNKGMSGPDALAAARQPVLITQTASLIWAGVVGVLIDRYHRVTCVAGALLIAAIGYIVLGLQADPFGPMGKLGCVIVGIGQMSVILTVQSLLGQESPVDIRGSVIGLSAFFGAIGILTTNLAGGFIFDNLAMSGPVILVGVANFCGFLYAARVWMQDGRPVRFDPLEPAPGNAAAKGKG